MSRGRWSREQEEHELDWLNFIVGETNPKIKQSLGDHGHEIAPSLRPTTFIVGKQTQPQATSPKVDSNITNISVLILLLTGANQVT